MKAILYSAKQSPIARYSVQSTANHRIDLRINKKIKVL